MGKKDQNRDETKETFIKLNEMIKEMIREREDIDFIIVNYNQTINDPQSNINRIIDFLELPNESFNKIQNAIDNKLYRQRRN